MYYLKQQENEIKKEIQILEKISQISQKPKSISKFYGYTNNKREFMLLFDYYPMTLTQYIDQNIPNIEIKTIFIFINDLLEGLLFLKNLNIAHRDLKPNNILVDSNNQFKIIDFGIAKKIETLMSSESFTTVGTPNYMSPELKYDNQTNQETTHIEPYKSDIYSLGLIILELLLGKTKKCAFDKMGDYISERL